MKLRKCLMCCKVDVERPIRHCDECKRMVAKARQRRGYLARCRKPEYREYTKAKASEWYYGNREYALQKRKEYYQESKQIN